MKDSDMSMITELPSETRTEGLVAKYVACFGIFLDFWTEKHDSETGIIENLRAVKISILLFCYYLSISDNFQVDYMFIYNSLINEKPMNCIIFRNLSQIQN